MKRNKSTVRVMHQKSHLRGTSRYAGKVASGRQLYGPGCCAHKVSHQAVETAKREARESGVVRSWL